MVKTITKKRAQEIASWWHGGQWSALYQFCSGGVLVPENGPVYVSELNECLEQLAKQRELWPGKKITQNERELKSLLRYFANNK